MAQTLRDEVPLRFRKVIKKSAKSAIKIFFMSLIPTFLIFVFLNGDIAPLPTRVIANVVWLKIGWISIVLLIMFSKMIYEYLYYRTYFYDVTKNNVVIRKGVISKREITLPLSKITDVYVEQDMYDVIFGLYEIQLSTPTAESGRTAHISGVNKKGADYIKELILQKIHDATSSTTSTSR